MFNVSQEQQEAQFTMAKNLMSIDTQKKFNMIKGSIPANMEVNDASFDICAKKSIADLKSAVKNDKMVGNIAHSHMVANEELKAIYTVVGEFMSTKMSA